MVTDSPQAPGPNHPKLSSFEVGATQSPATRREPPQRGDGRHHELHLGVHRAGQPPHCTELPTSAQRAMRRRPPGCP